MVSDSEMNSNFYNCKDVENDNTSTVDMYNLSGNWDEKS